MNIAALNAVKGDLLRFFLTSHSSISFEGKPMKQDVCSLTFSGKKRIYTFMSQALGLMADLDLGAHLLKFGSILSY